MTMTEKDFELLRLAIDVAGRAREHGNHPFGAILADENKNIVATAENTVVTERDCTGHAELNLVRVAWKILDEKRLNDCTIYSSTEPCAMCAGAIFWGGIGRLVYGLSAERLYELVGDDSEGTILNIACRDIFPKGQRLVEVIGPAMEEDAQHVHEEFWS